MAGNPPASGLHTDTSIKDHYQYWLHSEMVTGPLDLSGCLFFQLTETESDTDRKQNVVEIRKTDQQTWKKKKNIYNQVKFHMLVL